MIISYPKISPSLAVRSYAPDDLAGMTALWVASWNEAMPEIDFEARRDWFTRHIAALLAQNQHILIGFDRTAGNIAGFVTVDPATHVLDQLVVSVAHKGTGVAQILLDHARQVSPELLLLEVNSENPRARAFYTRQGFTEIGRGRNRLSGRETLKLAWRRPPADCDAGCRDFEP